MQSLETVRQENVDAWKEQFERVMPTIEGTIRHYFATVVHGRFDTDAWEESTRIASPIVGSNTVTCADRPAI